ncbi:amidase [Mesorhizobium sp. CN2-181]|uniref:amidase n=1 Tax=Mesorhizobium yinganensis TaxID=3157707 RepID=UPI0032B81119
MDRLGAGEATARALLEETLAAISATNGDWHVFTSIAADAARLAADASDERRRAGSLLGPLDGVPVAIKDNIDVAGLVTTNGASFRTEPASTDAVVVRRLRQAGAVIVGKLNMHEGALGATTDNPFWGRCENPRVPGHTPGGSSGGSGAAIAGGLVPITLGTDTMGSVRIPAAYCGAWGLKPTRGLVPTGGLSLLSWTLDSIGPLAGNADDLAQAFSAMAGRDPMDPDGFCAPDRIDPGLPAIDLTGVTLGVSSAVDEVACEPEVKVAYLSMLDAASNAGATVRPVDVAGWRPTEARRAGLLVSEAEGGFVHGREIDAGGDAFSSPFRAMIEYGRRAPGERLAAAYHRLRDLRAATLRAVLQVDVLLLPTAPQRAFPHGAPAPVNQADLTAVANIAGCPAVAFPREAADGGAPCSIQLIGRPWSDMQLIAIAREMDRLK